MSETATQAIPTYTTQPAEKWGKNTLTSSKNTDIIKQ